MSSYPFAWLTPEFEATDPLIPRTMQLRPSEWVVVFAIIEDMAKPWNWFQSDPSHATVEEVIAEFAKARRALETEAAMYIGEIREFATQDIPDGWLRCDGATYADSDYPLLATLIHENLRVDGTHFRVPDRVRRVAMDGIAVGAQEGAETHINTLAEMPEHAHEYEKTAVAASVVLGELAGYQLGAYETELTGFVGEATEWSILNPVEGAQVCIRAAWPTAG